VPIFFQHQIDELTRLAIWKIEETEEFFSRTVPLQREVTHPHKRLQHLAGRFLLRFLFADFPFEMIRIADTRKPYLPNEQYHFSISHCGDYAAAMVSKSKRVGVDIEIPAGKAEKIMHKFLNEKEQDDFHLELTAAHSRLPTLLWSVKEAVFKWYGDGGVDFRQHIQLKSIDNADGTISCFFSKTNKELIIHAHDVGELVLAWVIS
jgi:phosphopantetheinyl transferase